MKILWFGVFSDYVKGLMREMAPMGAELLFVKSKGDEIEHLRLLQEAEYIVPNGIDLSEKYLRTAQKTKLIQLWGAGVDKYNLPLLRELNIGLQNGVGLNAPAVAEMTILHILAVNRKLIYVDREMRKGHWLKTEMRDQCNSLYGKTIGLIGMGNIGQKVAELMQAFNVGEILYYDVRRLCEDKEKTLGLTYSSIDELMQVSDIVSLHLPLTQTTRKIISKDRIASMKSTAVLINTARGGLVDEEALIEALKAGKFRGAGLDTFEHEPLSPNSPLLSLDNVVLTSHIAGAVIENVVPRIAHVYDCIVKFEKGVRVDERYIVLSREEGTL